MPRRNPETAAEMYAVAIDALKESRMAKARSDKRKDLAATAKKIALEVHEQFPKARVPKELWKFLPQNVFDIDTVASWFDLPKWETVSSRNEDYIWETADQMIDATGDEDRDDELRMEAQQEVEGELFARWHVAVLEAAEPVLTDLGLQLEGVKSARGLPWQFRLTAIVNWRTAADRIRKLISGVGDYDYRYLSEFLESGPYTAQEAVIEHLGYLRFYADVYGTASPRARYDRAFR